MSFPDPANESTFWPPECYDAAFKNWAMRVSIKVLNLAPSADESAMRRVLVSEGPYGPGWGAAYCFLLEYAKFTRREALTA